MYIYLHRVIFIYALYICIYICIHINCSLSLSIARPLSDFKVGTRRSGERAIRLEARDNPRFHVRRRPDVPVQIERD